MAKRTTTYLEWDKVVLLIKKLEKDESYKFMLLISLGHTPRHTIANHLLDSGFSLVEIQSILLHAHPSTTMVYLKKRQLSKLANNTLRSFHAVMDAR